MDFNPQDIPFLLGICLGISAGAGLVFIVLALLGSKRAIAARRRACRLAKRKTQYLPERLIHEAMTKRKDS